MVLCGVGCVSEKEGLELKPVGGVLLKNKRGQVVFWFKAKDELGRSFGLCLFRPELADTPAMRVGLEQAFRAFKEMAASVSLPIFDMEDFEAELRKAFGELGVGAEEYVRFRRVEDMTFTLTDLVSEKRVEVVFGLHSVKPRRRRKRRGERP